MSSNQFSDNNTASVLCVDLDGTLIHTDTIWESVLLFLKKQPLGVFSLLFWLFKGRAYLKDALARQVSLDVSLLPFHEDFLVFLKQQKAEGRKIVLVTASHQQVAEQVAAWTGLFDEVIGSTLSCNLKGRQKADCLVKKFGAKNFDYAGNEWPDMKVWRVARRAIVVNASSFVLRAAQRHFEVSHVFHLPQSKVKTWLRALRSHQWIKNVLLFTPLIAAHHWLSLEGWLAAGMAFVSFSLFTSSVYVFNDLFDLEADRHHYRKKNRPFAGGHLQIYQGLIVIPLLFAGGVLTSLALPPAFLACGCAYYFASAAYSLRLKQIEVLDVLVLAGLYTIRIIAGAYAVGVTLSFWMLAFAVFLFLSLGLMKRFAELKDLRRQNKESAKGRGYLTSDLEQISSLGAASGYVAALVLALYLNSKEVSAIYHQPQILWGLCVLLLYWINRVWLLAHRGKMHEDPVIFTLTDKTSYAIAAAGLLLVALARPL
ncbi:MAG: UbiA family prenyltransferase [bacterium]